MSAGASSSPPRSPSSASSSGEEDETLASARERILAKIRDDAAPTADAAPTTKDDDDDILVAEGDDDDDVAPKRRRLQKQATHPAVKNVCSKKRASRARDDSDSDASESEDSHSVSDDDVSGVSSDASDGDESDAASDGDDASDSEDPYLRAGLRQPAPPAPLLSEAAATGAVWTVLAEQKRPSWSRAHMPSESQQAEERANAQTLAAVESAVALSKHDTALRDAHAAAASYTRGGPPSVPLQQPPPPPPPPQEPPPLTAMRSSLLARSGNVPGLRASAPGSAGAPKPRFRPSVRGDTIKPGLAAGRPLAGVSSGGGLAALARRHGLKPEPARAAAAGTTPLTSGRGGAKAAAPPAFRGAGSGSRQFVAARAQIG